MLKDIWIIMLLSGFIGIIISLILFFVWRVPDLIEDISGRKAKRQIALIRKMNSSTGSLGKFSTSEVYLGISSGLLSVDNLSDVDIKDSIEVNKVKKEVARKVSEEEISTSDLADDGTSYLSNEDAETSFMDTVIVKILEEYSSL